MGDWVSAVLGNIGAPDTNTNRTTLYAWADSEGMPSSENNWLATTLNCCGCSPINSTGVCSYPSVADGAQAIANTLLGGGYDSVVYWLRQGDNIRENYDAINQSPWCAGCQNGHYPIVLYNSITSGSGVPPSGGGPGGTGQHPPPLPPTNLKSDDWSGHIRRSGRQFNNAALNLENGANAIKRLRIRDR